MDKLTKRLNQKFADLISSSRPQGMGLPQGRSFSDVLNAKQSTATDQVGGTLFNRISGEMKASVTDFNVQSADGINVQLGNFEVERPREFDLKSRMTGLFSSLNEDILSMDATIEVLSDSNTRLNRRQMLALQFGAQNLAISVDLASKLAQVTVNNLNQLLNTQIA